MRKSIVDLSKAREEPLVRFLYLILDKLILLLVRPPIISGTVGINPKLCVSMFLVIFHMHTPGGWVSCKQPSP